jgi:hypothetical protein
MTESQPDHPDHRYQPDQPDHPDHRYQPDQPDHPDHRYQPDQPDHPDHQPEHPVSNCPPPPPAPCDPNTASLISAHVNGNVDHVANVHANLDIGGHDLVDLHVGAEIGHDILHG